MYQKTLVIGYLGKDPEMRYTPTGVPVTSFSVATTRRWTNANGEQQEKTTWFRVICWRKQAELTAQYLQKGALVLLEGEIDASAWTDREGHPRASLELTATNVRFLPGRGGAGEAAPAAGGTGAPTTSGELPGNEEDLPF
jgi:single-strand DNA-binding protein